MSVKMDCGVIWERIDSPKLIRGVCASMNASWEGMMRYPNTSRTGETLKEWCDGQLRQKIPLNQRRALAALSWLTDSQLSFSAFSA